MTTTPAIRPFERSARRDLRHWMMFALGVAFLFAGLTVDPAANCSSDGECAPWLVRVAKWVGFFVTLMGAGQILTNTRRGSRIDPETGELTWWQNRTARSSRQEGRIHPTRISRIRIKRNGDGDDHISLFDLEGNRQFWFDAEVIPWPQDRWIAQFAAAWPHIVVEDA